LYDLAWQVKLPFAKQRGERITLPHRKKHHQAENEQDPQVEPQSSPAEPNPEGDEAQESEAARLHEIIEALQQSLSNAEQDKLRALADFQNLRRRSQEEKDALRKFATENLVQSLLPVLDNFERTVQHLEAGADPQKMLEGIKIVERQLRQVLESQNLRRIESVGQPFDPDLHEALAMEPSEEHEENIVTTEVEPGYRIGDKVIRPARVKVAKNS
jgi:molecular chaperone GrpE